MIVQMSGEVPASCEVSQEEFYTALRNCEAVVHKLRPRKFTAHRFVLAQLVEYVRHARGVKKLPGHTIRAQRAEDRPGVEVGLRLNLHEGRIMFLLRKLPA